MRTCDKMENFKDKIDKLVGEYIQELEKENKDLKEQVKELVERNIEQEKKYKIVLDKLSLLELALQQATDGTILV